MMSSILSRSQQHTRVTSLQLNHPEHVSPHMNIHTLKHLYLCYNTYRCTLFASENVCGETVNFHETTFWCAKWCALPLSRSKYFEYPRKVHLE